MHVFKEIYPVAPLFQARFVALLMNDMGRRVFSTHDDSPFQNVDELRNLFKELKTRTLAISVFFASTDCSLAHNMVLRKDPKQLNFIDWDEGTKADQIMERTNDDPPGRGQHKWISD